MKKVNLILIASAFLLGANAMADISFGGNSAEYVYKILQAREQANENVKKYDEKSTFGSPVKRYELSNFLSCSKKEGWVFTSYSCNFELTSYEDIQASKYVNLKKDDDLGDVFERWNRDRNRRTFLPIGGTSASRIFQSLTQLKSDKAYSETTGATSILKRPYTEIVLSDLIACRKIKGLLGEYARCVVFNVTVADSNAEVVIDTDNK